MMNRTNHIWMNGQLVPWESATTHVMSHALHYGSSVFEGIRSYASTRGPVFFRLEDHIDRLLMSAHIYSMPLKHDRDALLAACHEVITKNELDAAYLRPLAYRGYGKLGLNPGDTPVDIIIAAVPWGDYHGGDSKNDGLDVRIVSWQRPAPNTLPAMAKAGGNYLSGQLVAAEAHRDGYHEGIALDVNGYVSEGSGMNVFAVKNGVLFTPTAASSILPGLTRDTVFHLAKELGLEVRSENLVREVLTIADEVFLVGTAAEITPVRSIDRKPIGAGTCGPITKRLQDAFADLINGRIADPHGYITAVQTSPAAKQVAV